MSLTPSETFKQLVLAFPRPRKPSNNLFRPFRALENLQTTCFGLSDASETFKQLVSAFPTPRGVRNASQVCRVRAFEVPGQLPCPGRGCPQTPGLSYVLIGISVRLHLAFASGFLSDCEGKGLYVRRACQYVILRISSRPCTWPECSFYRRPIYCLSAPYAFRGVPEIHEPQTILHVAINTSEIWFFWGRGENESRVHAEEILNMYPAFRF